MTITSDPDPITPPHASGRQVGQPLRTVLRINATTSFAAGLAALLAPETVDRLLGTGHPGWVRLVGGGLALFAVDVAALASARASRLLRWTPAVIAGDVSWVAASAVTIAAGWFTAAGTAAVAATAALVGTFAFLQRRHLAELRREWPAAA